jgi:hypothetical protein
MDNEEPLETDSAAENVAKLRLLPHFPTDPALLQALIELFVKWFHGSRRRLGKTYSPAEQCRAVVDYIVEKDETWKGPSRVYDVLNGILFPKPSN